MAKTRVLPAFVDWMDHVLHADIKPTTKLVCYVIRHHFGPDGSGSWPSIERISTLSGYSRRAVFEALKEAESSGLLRRNKRYNAEGRQTSNLYLPVIPDLRGAPPAPLDEGCTSCTEGCTTCTGEGAPPAPRTSPEGTIPSLRSGIGLPDWIDPEIWGQWLKARKAAGAKGTEYALQLNLKTLDKLREEGHDPTAVMEQSIEHGWKGLFPLKGERYGKNGQRLSATQLAERECRELEERERLHHRGDGAAVETADADLREPLEGTVWTRH